MAIYRHFLALNPCHGQRAVSRSVSHICTIHQAKVPKTLSSTRSSIAHHANHPRLVRSQWLWAALEPRLHILPTAIRSAQVQAGALPTSDQKIKQFSLIAAMYVASYMHNTMETRHERTRSTSLTTRNCLLGGLQLGPPSDNRRQSPRCRNVSQMLFCMNWVTSAGTPTQNHKLEPRHNTMNAIRLDWPSLKNMYCPPAEPSILHHFLC